MQLDCLAVRERLTEYAVSTLGADEEAAVERHLEWCAGCRKEARELREAAATVGLSLPPAEPPEALEDVVVQRVQAAARANPARPRRSRIRTAVGVALAAALAFSLGTTGVLIAQRQSAVDRLHSSQAEARSLAQQFEALLRDLERNGAQPQDITRAVLAPTPGHAGGGGALLVESPRFEDIAVVFLGGLSERGLPYRVWLANGGQRLSLGRIAELDTGGGANLPAREFAQDLRKYRAVEVRDSRGRLVLLGLLQARG